MGRESLGVENLVLSGTDFPGATTAPEDLPLCPPETGSTREHAQKGPVLRGGHVLVAYRERGASL